MTARSPAECGQGRRRRPPLRARESTNNITRMKGSPEVTPKKVSRRRRIPMGSVNQPFDQERVRDGDIDALGRQRLIGERDGDPRGDRPEYEQHAADEQPPETGGDGHRLTLPLRGSGCRGSYGRTCALEHRRRPGREERFVDPLVRHPPAGRRPARAVPVPLQVGIEAIRLPAGPPVARPRFEPDPSITVSITLIRSLPMRRRGRYPTRGHEATESAKHQEAPRPA